MFEYILYVHLKNFFESLNSKIIKNWKPKRRKKQGWVNLGARPPMF